MLLELNIENFAIIDKLNISFDKGFNVLTGETGAGKSIIIDAIGLVLGDRATKEYIRAGQKKAVIEALFCLNNYNEIKTHLNKFGIDCETDQTLLVTREIHISGRSVSRINGRTVTISMLKELTNFLVDIHGQHEHQSLLFWENHIEYIDSLGSTDMVLQKDKISNEFNKLMSLKDRLKNLSYDDMERERKIDLLEFQFKEIDDAGLKLNEEKDLVNQYNISSHTEEIINSLNSINQNLNYSDYNQTSVIDKLNEISVYLKKILNYDSNLATYHNYVLTIVYQLQDLAIDLRNYLDNIEYDPEKAKYLEERIDLLNKLKRKYGESIEEIIKYKDEIASELDFIANSEEEIKKVKEEILLTEKTLCNLTSKLTNSRKVIAKNIEEGITKELTQLNMNNISFKVKFDKLDYYTVNGNDRLEFLISTNIGEPLKPLSKIASGGEISRIMLAFKTILAEVDNIGCLVFDEIDTGISGRTAQIVGEKIANISNTHQILCITHLPQIAAMADNHFLIEKVVERNRVNTKVIRLEYEERIEELSRLLGGVNLTNTTKMHAKEMIEMSKKIEC